MYINNNLDKFKHIYDMQRLKRYSDWAESDIKRIEEVLEKLKNYQMEIHVHAQTVANTEFKSFVTLVRRKDYDTNLVKYNVQLEKHPIVTTHHVEGERVHGFNEHYQMFGGRERTLAINYAEELAKENNCEIERRGFNAT
ncbi:hypothetical protein [Bacillus mycoides]|uniref:hypothetical protein n=1 Tax=Bacillus mycoides TaxID=1405 RepID=UPI001C032EE6|nr:hypothetical protein [Bacillus mycoides]QWG92809.1 hypothetical protein EXW40_27485 [Bacillus mycoides]